MKRSIFSSAAISVALSLSGLAHASESTVIAAKQAELMKVLNGQVVYKTLQRANEANKNLTQEQIQKADEQWRRSRLGNLLSSQIQNNACSKALIAFQKKNKTFAEIFITDKRGLNVCQTNHTTDYYQADEAWWTNAYNAQNGRNYIGKVEFDRSADVTVIPIYIPIKDKNQNVIGVCKALISLY